MVFMTGIILLNWFCGIQNQEPQLERHSAEVTTGIVCSSTPVCAAFFRSRHSAYFVSLWQRYFSCFRLLRKAYRIPSGGTQSVLDRKSGTTETRRSQQGPGTGSEDDLFATQMSNGGNGASGSIELQSVVVK
ncbi:hypothetical protein CC80DRAFT_498760 [Byssothecium circinans]|uniref:Uncharacterized protein n=1 Tax=Byssothecium circinans TaxID=147558 RepID=A0A6A5UIJ6_9PLEO|nr:hypothetical protein CC80DRAFT_498760 [Byssothecium circinans]